MAIPVLTPSFIISIFALSHKVLTILAPIASQTSIMISNTNYLELTPPICLDLISLTPPPLLTMETHILLRILINSVFLLKILLI